MPLSTLRIAAMRRCVVAAKPPSLLASSSRWTGPGELQYSSYSSMILWKLIYHTHTYIVRPLSTTASISLQSRAPVGPSTIGIGKRRPITTSPSSQIEQSAVVLSEGDFATTKASYIYWCVLLYLMLTCLHYSGRNHHRLARTRRKGRPRWW